MPPFSATNFTYDRAQVTEWLDAATVAKGTSLRAAVSHLNWDGAVLCACVQGSQRLPYEVAIEFSIDVGQLEIDGECSCPVAYDCKHIAATLLVNLERQQEVAPAVSTAGNASMRPELIEWLEAFRLLRLAGDSHQIAGKKATHALVYALSPSSYDARCEVQFFKASRDKHGHLKAGGISWNNVENALLKPPQFVDDDDLPILRMLWASRIKNSYGGFVLAGKNGAEILASMMATGRLAMLDARTHSAGPLLVPGSPRAGSMAWHPGAGDRLRPQLQTSPPSSAVIMVDPVWYVDRTSGEAGVVELPWPASQIRSYLEMPPISAAEAPLVASVLHEIAPGLPAPPTAEMAAITVLELEPVPVLHLNSLPVYGIDFARAGRDAKLDHACISFRYGDFALAAESTTTLVKSTDGALVQVKRRMDAEKARLAELRSCSLAPLSRSSVYGPQPFPTAMWGLRDAEAWQDFMQHAVPLLRTSGWRVDMQKDFRFNVIDIDAIAGHVREAADGWFDVEMEIAVGDRSVRLEPLLAALFRRDGRWLGGGLDAIADDEAVDVTSERGERLRFRALRLKPVVRLLIDLFDTLGAGTMQVSRFDAGRLAALHDTGRWIFHGDDAIRTLAQRLQGGAGVTEVALPAGLQAVLRPYQQQGLAWMQYLREQGLAGVLADDMGLGKTIQTLAHILAEKESGRLDRPALIVVPTSLVHNWQDEARRFAPALRVLRLHGSERKAWFDKIDQYDLVLTTYALLWRDQEALTAQAYHLLILDEAQFVKNARSKAATAIRHLEARHRLCLTGTPLENHLGELWSLFDFLLPGFLGTEKDFGKRWRTPIEKGGDTVRRDLLARRIRPFMLRRRKDEVATELPAKTLIVQSVELDGGQRDLYETVRTAMHEKVRSAVAAQGLARSHIVVLDALLKLRQVCCDPRLVKLARAGKVRESAKLEMLFSMLPDLIEAGRRVLVFSQFTGMLALIAEAAEKAGLPYVELTGDTKDRATPVRRFQAGEVPLFLISLKAGGVGLNLTAADTVIHYDPWWNPAAENQATDRAHRLGQDKPVFVYKLIVAGSIEEKIVAMQEKKAALAAGILSEDGAAAVKFSAADLEVLFAAIPAIG